MLQSTRISQRELSQAFGALIFAANAHSAPLHCLALEGRDTCVPGSHGTVTIEEMILGRVQPPALHKQETETLSSSLKELYMLAQGLWPKGQASGLTYI